MVYFYFCVRIDSFPLFNWINFFSPAKTLSKIEYKISDSSSDKHVPLVTAFHCEHVLVFNFFYSRETLNFFCLMEGISMLKACLNICWPQEFGRVCFSMLCRQFVSRAFDRWRDYLEVYAWLPLDIELSWLSCLESGLCFSFLGFSQWTAPHSFGNSMYLLSKEITVLNLNQIDLVNSQNQAFFTASTFQSAIKSNSTAKNLKKSQELKKARN